MEFLFCVFRLISVFCVRIAKICVVCVICVLLIQPLAFVPFGIYYCEPTPLNEIELL